MASNTNTLCYIKNNTAFFKIKNNTTPSMGKSKKLEVTPPPYQTKYFLHNKIASQ